MSVIYKIYCLDENIKDCYIGSTNDLITRKRAHKKCCNNINNNRHNLNVYKFIRANGGWENFDFMILEQFETIINKNELLKIERKYIEKKNSTLNTYIPLRTKKDTYLKNEIWRKNNMEKCKETRKNYREKNREVIYLKQKQKIECEYCKSFISKQNILRHHKSKKCLDTQS